MNYPGKMTGRTPEAQQRQLEGLRKGRRVSKERAREARKRRKVFDPDRWGHIYEADIIQFVTDPDFLGLDLYPGQRVLLKAQYGLALEADELPIYRELTTLSQVPAGVPGANPEVFEPDVEKSEACWVIGVRGTKSTTAAAIALYESMRPWWHESLRPNEPAYFIHIAQRQKSTQQIVGGMCRRMLEQAGPALQGAWVRFLTEEIELVNGIRIHSFPTNSTSYLGLPCIGAILDECAYYYRDGPKADEEIVRNLRPRMAQFGGRAKMLQISSPVAKSGILWDSYKEGSQVPGRLTVHAPTWVLNPTIEQEWYDKERAADPDGFTRNYKAQFCERVESLFSDEMLEAACSLAGELGPQPHFIYMAGLDASGLAGRDRMAFAIAHMDGAGNVVGDLVRSWDIRVIGIDDIAAVDAMFDEIGELGRAYRVAQCWLDQYALGYVRTYLAKQGLEGVVRPTLATVMINLRNLMVRRRAMLPMDPELRDGLEKTQAFWSRQNLPSIGRERSAYGHGDKADAVGSAVWGASQIDEKEQDLLVVHDVVDEYGPVCPGLEEGGLI